MKRKFSIIVPAFNVENYISECLDSVLAQTYTNFEIIIVNDGSTDSTLSIIEKYSNSFKNIRVVDQDNKGLSAARNVGKKLASGEYLYFLDSDDIIDSNMLSSVYDILRTDGNIDIVLFDAMSFIDGDVTFSRGGFDYERDINEGKYTGLKLLDIALSKNKHIVSACCYVTKKESFEHINFPDGVLYEDNYYTTKILAENKTCYVSKDKHFNRRIRPDSITTQKPSMKHAEGYYSVADLLYSELKENLVLKKYISDLFNAGIKIEFSIFKKVQFKRKLHLYEDSLKFNRERRRFFMRIFFPVTYNKIRSLRSSLLGTGS